MAESPNGKSFAFQAVEGLLGCDNLSTLLVEIAQQVIGLGDRIIHFGINVFKDGLGILALVV